MEESKPLREQGIGTKLEALNNLGKVILMSIDKKPKDMTWKDFIAYLMANRDKWEVYGIWEIDLSEEDRELISKSVSDTDA